MAFTFEPLAIPDVVKITPEVFGDDRGFFLELFKSEPFTEAGLATQFVQFNVSKSQGGVVRGLHYQLKPHAQGKLVTVVRGEIFDVAVDIRRGSPHFGSWVSVTLSAEDHTMVYVPPGFAHGFAVMSEAAEVIYYITKQYAPDQERGILWNDPTVGITWPVTSPILSAKDQAYPVLAEAEINF